MRISDWSSDVCSSDLARYRVPGQQRIGVAREFEGAEQVDLEDLAPLVLGVLAAGSGEVAAGIVDQDVEAFVLVFDQIGRAHVSTPVTNAHLVCRLLLETKNITTHDSPCWTMPYSQQTQSNNHTNQHSECKQ